MVLVSGVRSTLNPNAPLFIPAAVRQVEDFSPEWWELVTTATWFRDYWLTKHRREENGFYSSHDSGFDGTDIADLLPDSIDIGLDDDFANMEAQFEEFIQYSQTREGNKSSLTAVKGFSENGLPTEAEALIKNFTFSKERGPKSPPMEPVKYWEKPAKCASPKCSP